MIMCCGGGSGGRGESSGMAIDCIDYITGIGNAT